MALPNKEYWIDRSEQLEDKVFKDTLKFEKELDKVYRQHISEIVTKIESFFHKYAKENKISLQEAELRLQGLDWDEYQGRMSRLLYQYSLNKDPLVLAEISRITTAGQISRLDGLLNEMIVALGMLSTNVQKDMATFLGGVYEEVYYKTIYNVHKGTGIGKSFSKLNKQAINEVLNYKWSGDMFSSRIWKNKDKLIQELREELTRGMIQGISTQEMTRNLRDKMKSSTFNAKRLVRTEATFVLNEASAKGYEQCNLEKFEFLATLDSRTSKICGSMDGKIFLVSERKQGVNFPPLHAFCRSTTIPYFEDYASGSRIARDEDGKNYYVNAKTTFEDWKKHNNI